jgi:hypothetical protein
MSMSEHNLGSGQYLDETFDFEVDTTGDIRASDGIEEVEKDLSFQMAITLSQFLGEQPTQEVEAEIKRMAYRVGIADVRVANIDRTNITVNWSNDMKQFDVGLPLTIETGEEYELVFEV